MPKKDKKKVVASATANAEGAKKVKAAKAEKVKAAKDKKVKAPKVAKVKVAKAEKVKAPGAKKVKAAKAKKAAKGISTLAPMVVAKAELISSVTVYQGPLFRVQHDKLVEPDGLKSERDVIRHNGSVVILAIDASKSKKNPWIVIERQYRHAANQYLWELPAGKLDAGEEALAGAKRELAEETGYSAKKWKPLVTYFASPGFLGESMIVFQAEGLIAGQARPEEDEKIEFRLVKLNEVLKMIEKGAIKDGKTLTSVLLYARKMGRKGKK